MLLKTCFTTVSDIALCQRCPALLAYKIHRHDKKAWLVGIKGGEAYGSIFHKNIAKTFFEAASNRNNILHSQIVKAASRDFTEFENLIREKFFMPFLESSAKNFTSSQLLAMASGVKVWARATWDFLSKIKSLANSSEKVFIRPEQKLQGYFDFEHDSRLVITGCYDALLFNPDNSEARLFEFKSYNKSDLTVPLSQSLVYAWLIQCRTGITPSIEIIYLDEIDRKPDIFNSSVVQLMIKNLLPDLFMTAYKVISLKKFPVLMRDEKLCSACKFRFTCERDISSNFAPKRKGVSLVTVLVFLLFAAMLMTQVFFFSLNSFESLTEEREIVRARLGLKNALEWGKNHLVHKKEITGNDIVNVNYYYIPESNKSNAFYDAASIDIKAIGDTTVIIYDLDYTFTSRIETFDDLTTERWNNLKPWQQLFPAMPGKFLVRAFTPVIDGNNLMIEEVISEDQSGDKKILLHQEIWYR